ncbi:MAG: hypothetical protein Tp178MES00d2C33159091_33 [Prokaryotic dsDNA virus sp.]|uniref:hypothetical protein n=1 Tax=Thalassospira sp. TaxID=1912094 RepID=UPI000C45BB12|nr:hypothetical protein [Thalassospira sp.]QDP60982.1 MAG: hypothetical protein Tp178MES00d2C33159091_33 [Prokaryotic dsDNA virus sp.]MAZ33831.1 hypothetical protein [Thalassospira sp.]MAZ33887.1 hypothetical protein [Thalassospira sp.]MAZ34620.1 hypothetical protein [Thalassospira sp.]QDP64513.1 MAG: hypothetical protein Tp178SUR1139111_33 [Prokaryotic dsDNA virus sp.]|tara:strand:- start:34559 stop:36844 length:2286 start_codon:yes stop_codon:yes gene_type:complete
MARATTNKLYRTFVKGLVSEASPLTYPEDTSYDELNTVLSRKGSRTRRLGINYLANTKTPNFVVPGFNRSSTEYVWKAVAEQPDTNFLVVQKGLTIKFFDMSTNVSADSLKSFEIDLNDYIIAGRSDTSASKELFQFASGKGYLFIVSQYTEPLVVTYDIDADDIEVNSLNILIRDFDGLDDGLANDEEPVTLSKEHHYNLLNQGWLYGTQGTSAFNQTAYEDYVLSSRQVIDRPFGQRTSYSRSSPSTSPIALFKNQTGRYPGNNKQWWVARAEADNPDDNVKAGDFLPEVLDKLYSGNNRAPNGHFILNAFKIDRSGVSGVSGIPTDIKRHRPEAVSFFSGRAWYGSGSVVYFSQILDSTGIKKAAMCYQEADPTSEDISDLIASDGGVVPIPEANRIRRILPMANGVLVFAQNGVWFISGGDEGFSGVSIAVSKVSSLGTKSPMAAIEVDGTLFWWSEIGIDAMQQASGQFGPIPGKFGNTSVSEQTIQSIINEIPETQRQYVKSCFDPRNNTVMWLFSDGIASSYYYRYNKVLLFDVTLQAFFLWEFATQDDRPKVSGIYNNIGESFSTTTENVIDSLGNPVTTNASEPVVIANVLSSYVPSSVQYLVDLHDGSQAIATTSDTNFVDWSSWNGTGYEYDSFVETGYEIMGDAMRDKQPIYVFCHFKQAEDSSCRMRAKWDWANSLASNRWSTEVEVYRERRRPNNSTADNTAFDVVTTKNKVRGSGKSIQFRYGTSERGKNFELLGWSVAYVGNTQP